MSCISTADFRRAISSWGANLRRVCAWSLALCCLYSSTAQNATAVTLPDLGTNPVIKYKKKSGTKRKVAQAPATTDGGAGTGAIMPDEIPELRGLGKNTPAERKQLEELADQTAKSEGAVFVTPEKVLVQKPMLTALITLNRDLPSPYELEAVGSKEISLRQALNTARLNNCEIQINLADVDEKRWQYLGSIGGFLPSFTNDYQMQAITGNYATASGIALPIKNLYLTSQNSFQQYLYKGGSILHSYLQAKYNYRASKYGLNRTTADILSEAAQDYHQLVLQDVLLQIRVKAVQVAQGLVILNKDLFEDGVNTMLDVLQSQYELSKARQDLIQQQVKRRQAAVTLATNMNVNPETDFLINDRLVSMARLVDPTAKVNDLVTMALENRPELKRYEQLRLAAIEQIKVARSALLPQVSTTGSIIGTSTRVSNINSNSAATGLSSSGAGVGAASLGTLPLSSSASSNEKHWVGKSLFIIGLDANWSIGGATVTEIGAINAAKATARKVQAEFNRELTLIYKDVHDQYLSSLSAENLVRETTDAVKAAEEQLRVAQVRFSEGVGTYIDVITAQRNYTNALVDKAQALIDFNIAQTKLVRSVGRVSVDSLVTIDSVRTR